ncbi:MAG: S9 family peptidase [Flavobacteriaceae bacterium]|nr:S9 family peptidase [Flavobacteriaceae bacterium]|tara:strand:- start:19135 stop:21555 length:2421 start_codon:yes stop_codon:yes gene_type:complete
MNYLKNFTVFFLLFFSFVSYSQKNLTYQIPKKEILDLVDVDRAPSVLKDEKNNYMVFVYRPEYKSIDELSQKEMRLGGLRVNPYLNIGSRTTYYNKVKILRLKKGDKSPIEVKGLPTNPKLSNFVYSPDQSKIAMINTTSDRLELWVLNIEKALARRINTPSLNATLGSVINWFSDNKSLLIKIRPENSNIIIDQENMTPTGPTITENMGDKAQNRTYQDLLKNITDENNFEQLSRSKLIKVSLKGKISQWLDENMYRSISFSPDGKYVLVNIIKKPFSYIVTYSRFPNETLVYDLNGKLIKKIAESPLLEVLPKGFMATKVGKRSISWRNDLPSSLRYIEALDGGDPSVEVDYRDKLMNWDAPFNKNPEFLIKTINRINNINWGNENFAIVRDIWWNNRNTKTYLFNPSNSNVKPKIISDRNYQDIYSNPGSYVTKRNDYNRSVLLIKNNNLFRIADGFSKEGQFPYVEKLNINDLSTATIYKSNYETKFENIIDFDFEKNELFVRIESKQDFPNYYFRKLSKNNILDQITFFKNPFESLKKVSKQTITYKREDGLDLSGVLYLPPDYDKTKPERKPMILWAYPREYKDKNSASQKTNNPNRFIYPSWASPIYWVTQGYVLLDRASFPIIGEKDVEPNDSFRNQLVSNAKAAIDELDKKGYIDPKKVAVGGHSYGAFMVANLLSHSNLFSAGIARSGAYNRTLTPFGFQSEERTYWEAPEVYYRMSPFMHADKMKTPLLLIHGEADNNSGTYPMQSKRYFNALKGLGATVRLVMFPKESHGYRAKETILHLLWEQDQWLEKYLKN